MVGACTQYSVMTFNGFCACLRAASLVISCDFFSDHLRIWPNIFSVAINNKPGD